MITKGECILTDEEKKLFEELIYNPDKLEMIIKDLKTINIDDLKERSFNNEVI